MNVGSKCFEARRQGASFLIPPRNSQPLRQKGLITDLGQLDFHRQAIRDLLLQLCTHPNWNDIRYDIAL